MSGTIFKVRDENNEGMDLLIYEDLVMPTEFQKLDLPNRLKAIKELEYKEGDVLLCTSPKAGSHWFANLLDLMRRTGPIDTSFSLSLALIDYMPLETVESRPYPRIIASHMKLDRLPTDHTKNGGKTVLLLRNPKDSAVSLYYHMQEDKLLKNKQSWNSFVTSYLNGEVPFGSFFDYVNSWQANMEKNKDLDVLVIYYEDLKKDCLSELKKVQKFFGLDNTDERLQQIIERCSLDKQNAGVTTGRTFVYRMGDIGAWKKHMTVAQNEAFDTVIEDKLKNSIFKFQYE